MSCCPSYLHSRFTFQYLFICITYIHIACNLPFNHYTQKWILSGKVEVYYFQQSDNFLTYSQSVHINKSRNMFLTICILLASDIHTNPSIPILQEICLATSNLTSVHNKSASITDLVISNKLDILAFTETWLNPHDTTSSVWTWR